MSNNRLSVYFYAPNLVGTPIDSRYVPIFVLGYARILLCVGACVYMAENPLMTAGLYTLSCLLDAVDGYLARLLNQSSHFGAVLDMITDRSTTSCLMCWLCVLYPDYVWVFQFLISLDLSSHYMHMVSTLSSGSSSHKQLDGKSWWILRLYYENKSVLFGLCAVNELFWLLLYLAAYPELDYPLMFMGSKWNAYVLLAWISGPLCAMKHVMNLFQLLMASQNLVALEAKHQTIKKSK